MELKTLLTDLAGAVGIGHRQEVAKIAKEYLTSFSKVTETKNYLSAEIGEGERTIMLEAHMDEIGMIVTHVHEDGFLTVTNVGSIDTRFLPSQPVVIYGKQTVNGVFTSLPPHLNKDDAAPSFDHCYIDTGNKNIGEIVSPGDIVLFDSRPITLKNDRFTGKALDNRSGMAAVIAAGEELSKSKLPFKVVLLFPMGEELGLRGAKVAAFDSEADECIAVDVSFGDCPDVPPSKTAKLGSGAMIGVSPVLDRGIYKKLEDIAISKGIPHTLEVMGGTTSTDADIISLNQSGIPCGLISIPLRNMHTPCEVLDIKDVKAVTELIVAYVRGGGLNG